MKGFSSGAVRSSDAESVAFSLITPIGLKEVAKLAAKTNWERSPNLLLSYAYDHANDFLGGSHNTDDLAYAALFTMAAMDCENNHSEQLIVYRNDTMFPRYDMLPQYGLLMVAETYREGADKYGVYNWEKGMDVLDLLNHALNHINRYWRGYRDEPDLAHAAWGFLAAIHSYILWPHLNTSLRLKGCYVEADSLCSSIN